MEKRIGPRMEPWGTPQKILAEEEEKLPITETVLLLRYEVSQARALLPVLTLLLRRSITMAW